MHPLIRFTAPVEIQAKAKGPRRFTARAYNGGALRIPNWQLPVVIDLAGMTARAVVAANLDHKNELRVGQVDAVQNDGRSLTLSGVVSAASSAAAEFLASSDNGYRWGASIEAAPDSVEEVPKGQTVTANGRTFAGPLYLTRRSTLVAVAFLAVPADEESSVAIAAHLRGANKMSANKSFQDWVSEVMLTDPADMTHEQLALCHASYEGRNGDEVTAADRAAVLPMIVASADPVDVEARRLRQIEAACKGEWGEDAPQVAALRVAAIAAELSVDELISQLRPIRGKLYEDSIPMATCNVGPSRRDGDGQVIEAALCLTGGLQKPEQHFPEPVLDAADKMRGFGLQQILLAAAMRNGYHVRPGEHITQANMASVLRAAFQPIHGAGFSTLSLPNTLANTANKFLRDGWTSVDQTILRIATVRSVRDFKQITTVSLTGGFVFQKLPPGGELEHAAPSELVYTNQADTYGIMFAIDRRDIINDDLDALTAAPRLIGRGGMLKLNDIGWTIYLNNGSFFHTSHNNVSTGTGSALGLTGLQIAERIFLNQVDPNGNPLGVMPAILLVPPSLKATALSLMSSQLVIDGTATAAQPSGNVWQQRYRVESSPYLENANYTGYSAAAWYLLAEPSALPVLEIAALNGRVEPTVETADTDFNTLGIQLRGYSDVGVALQEYRGGVRSAGS